MAELCLGCHEKAERIRELEHQLADLRAALYGTRSTRCICQTWRGSHGGVSSLERPDCPVHGRERRGA